MDKSEKSLIINDNNFIIYQDDNGIIKVSVHFSDDDIWLTKNQIAELCDTSRQNIQQHIESIYEDKELDREATCKNFLQVRLETREVERNIEHYNLSFKVTKVNW